MSDLPIKATLKSGTGYDAPWLTIDAADPNDLDFKLSALLEGSAVQKVIEVANLFKAANNAGPLLSGVAEPVAQAPAPQQPAAWGSSNPAAQPQWSQPAQQAAPQQRGPRPGAQLHPEGKTCDSCPNVLEYKKTQSGKAKWQCPDWRWNNGNPNNHTADWIN